MKWLSDCSLARLAALIYKFQSLTMPIFVLSTFVVIITASRVYHWTDGRAFKEDTHGMFKLASYMPIIQLAGGKLECWGEAPAPPVDRTLPYK